MIRPQRSIDIIYIYYVYEIRTLEEGSGTLKFIWITISAPLDYLHETFTNVLYCQIVNMQITRSKGNWFCKLIIHDQTFITNTHILQTHCTHTSFYNSSCYEVPRFSLSKTFILKKDALVRNICCCYGQDYSFRVKQKLIVETTSCVFG